MKSKKPADAMWDELSRNRSPEEMKKKCEVIYAESFGKKLDEIFRLSVRELLPDKVDELGPDRVVHMLDLGEGTKPYVFLEDAQVLALEL